MKTLSKTIAITAIGLLTLGASAAMAADGNKGDRGKKARKSADVSISVSVGNGRYDQYDRRGRNDRSDRGDRGRKNGYRGRNGRIVQRKVFDTRHRARIILTEEIVRGRRNGRGHSRRGPRLLCTVEARGPEARYVRAKRMHKIARNYCSRRARVKVYA